MQVVSSPSKPQTYNGWSPRRNPRWSTFSLALAAGLAAALLTFLLVRGRLGASAAVPARVSIVVAARDIPTRTRLTAAWLRVRQAPPGGVPDDAVATAAELSGKVTTEPVSAGKAVTRSAVTAANAALGMAFALPPSQRAMTVALDPADSAEQFARPGDHVDILATDEPGSGPAEARTVLQNVRLLAVGTQTLPDAAPASAASGPQHVTVAVSPAQAQALVLAAARGKIHLALRAADDNAVVSVPAFPVVPTVREAARPAPSSSRPRPRRAAPAPPVKAVEEALPQPPLPVKLTLPPAHVSVTVIKGSQSQTVSVEP